MIGIDPGVAITGWGIVTQNAAGDTIPVAYGVVNTPAHTPLATRLQMIYEGLTEIVTRYQPNSAAIEQLFFSRNVTTALAVGHGRGVAMLALANGGLAVAEYKPLEIKQAVVGYGGAEKKQVQRMVAMLLGLEEIPRPDDAADALAVAMCHLHAARFNDLVANA